MKPVGIVPFAIPSLFATAQDPAMMKGDAGANGKDGSNGTKGDTGAAGKDGKDGAQGVQGIPGVAGKDGTNGLQGIQGVKGDTGAQGIQGVAGSAVNMSFAAPTSRTMVLATAYQATNTAKPALFTITLEATSSFTLSGTVSNVAQIVIGAASTVAAGTGTAVATYKNIIGGGLVVGVSITSQQANTYTIALPAGWFLAVRQTTGTGMTVAAFEQQVG